VQTSHYVIDTCNVPLQISRGIFVYGEIMQTHTIDVSNETVIKLPRNGNNKAKKNLIQFIEVIKHN